MNEFFAQALDARTQDILDRCTRCGGCFEVCPMTKPAEIADRNAVDVVTGVLKLIRGEPADPDAERWAGVCSGSGTCIPRCNDGVNPRFMLALARLAMQRRTSADEQRAKGSAAFSARSQQQKYLKVVTPPVGFEARLSISR